MEFDYIVVGAGSAGCVVANRLSARADKRVLLVEAGGDDRPLHNPRQFFQNLMIQIPAGYRYTVADRKVSWGYNAHLCGADGGRMASYPRGRVLGGSSSINGMLYVRGQSADYDRWAQLGCTGWSWNDVLPLFMRAEDQCRGADDAHAVGGPLSISDVEGHAVSDAVLAAAAQAGFAAVADVNRGDQEGFARVQTTMRRGRRRSAAAAYLHPVRGRKNLHIETDTLATRILLRERRAIGVRLRKGSEERDVTCRGEIILCGGVINSPQLLQLSGIGDPVALSAAGVAPRHALPAVGRNLQDHFTVLLRCRLRPNTPSINTIAHGPRLALQAARYLGSGRGILAAPPTDVIGFVRSRPELASPDIQIHSVPASADPQTGQIDAFPGLTIAPCQLHPESRGHVHIASPDPARPPEISLNFLAASEDRRAIAAGIRIVRRLTEQPALNALILERLDADSLVDDDEALAAYAERVGSGIFHGSGTCAMGVSEAAVVDPQLRVRGITGLRVADASIMPRIISGNTNAAAMMIGEKASDLILAES